MNTFGKVGQVIRPGQHGSRKWTEAHGDKLVRVRYRYDSASCLRFTTVELVVEAAPWQPATVDTVLIHVGFEEQELRQTLKRRGATWEPGLRRWRVPTSLIEPLGLENRLDSRDHSS